MVPCAVSQTASPRGYRFEIKQKTACPKYVFSVLDGKPATDLHIILATGRVSFGSNLCVLTLMDYHSVTLLVHFLILNIAKFTCMCSAKKLRGAFAMFPSCLLTLLWQFLSWSVAVSVTKIRAAIVNCFWSGLVSRVYGLTSKSQ